MTLRPGGVVVAVILALVGVLGPAQSPAFGQSLQYKVVFSLDCTSAQACTVAQLPSTANLGVWLTFELSTGGSGKYVGADCARNLGGLTGTFSESGQVTWQSVSRYDDVAMQNVQEIQIKGVTLVKGTTSVTIRVPAATGQYVLKNPSDALEVGKSTIGLKYVSDFPHVQVSQ